MKGIRGGVDCCELLEQFKVATVTLLSSKIEANKFLVGSKKLICAVTKSLNLFATSMFFAAPHQKFLESNILCIPLVHASQPIDKKIWTLSLLKVTPCDRLCHSIGQVIELWSALMSKPHTKTHIPIIVLFHLIGLEGALCRTSGCLGIGTDATTISTTLRGHVISKCGVAMTTTVVVAPVLATTGASSSAFPLLISLLVPPLMISSVRRRTWDGKLMDGWGLKRWRCACVVG
jgi:hypothetical protein